AEDARIQAEKEVAEKQKAIEEEQKRIAAEQKAREEEIARKKAEEEARKAAEEAQRKFEESLTASGMSDADFNALCKMVQAEDGHDSIEGRIGIANVILNRVRNPRFPNSIMGVISAPGQFGPFHNGAYAAAVPSASTVEAVKKAISGVNTVGGALYFHRGGSFNGKVLVASAGAHCFFA
nr:cell wall hydrolase [Lachnospiraceae bacterium]